MITFIHNYLPLVVVLSHVALGLLFLSLLFSKSSGQHRVLAMWVGEHSLRLGLLTTLVAIVGSLFFSNIIGYPPCDLCWWQRVFIFPQAVLFLVAVTKRTHDVWKYVVPLSLISAIISVYNLFVQFSGNSFLPCSASVACDRLYVLEYGYITIPTMSLTIALTILLLAWARRVYASR